VKVKEIEDWMVKPGMLRCGKLTMEFISIDDRLYTYVYSPQR